MVNKSAAAMCCYAMCLRSSAIAARESADGQQERCRDVLLRYVS